jgi:hypothetical protein
MPTTQTTHVPSCPQNDPQSSESIDASTTPAMATTLEGSREAAALLGEGVLPEQLGENEEIDDTNDARSAFCCTPSSTSHRFSATSTSLASPSPIISTRKALRRRRSASLPFSTAIAYGVEASTGSLGTTGTPAEVVTELSQIAPMHYNTGGRLCKD